MASDGVSASSTTSALGLFAPMSARTPDGRKRKVDYNKILSLCLWLRDDLLPVVPKRHI